MKNKLNNKLFRYIIAGGLSYAIELGLILLLIYSFGVSDIVSVAAAFWVGLTASFVLQKLFAFSSKTTKNKTIRQLLLYMLLVCVNYIFTLGFVATLNPIIGVAIARTVALIITTSWNFIIYNKIIFKRK